MTIQISFCIAGRKDIIVIHRGDTNIGVWVKREYRLTQTTDFERVRRCGKYFAHPLLVLQVAKRDDGDLKIGIIASRALGSAVMRNRVKRRIRECISEMLPLIQNGWDIVLVPKKPIATVPYKEIKTICSELLIRARLANL